MSGFFCLTRRRHPGLTGNPSGLQRIDEWWIIEVAQGLVERFVLPHGYSSLRSGLRQGAATQRVAVLPGRAINVSLGQVVRNTQAWMPATRRVDTADVVPYRETAIAPRSISPRGTRVR